MPEERSTGYMSRHVFDRSVAEARRAGIKTIRLYSTAEPTLHPKFDELVGELVRGGFRVGVSTNAATLKQHMPALAELDTLQYSIEGWDQTSYEKFRYPLKFERVRRNISAFWEFVQDRPKRPLITCNLLLTRSTDIEAFVACWGPLVDRITVGFLMGTTVYRGGRFVNEENPEIESDYYDHTVGTSGTCGYPFDVITVAFDGKIALCCEDFTAEMPLGSIDDGVDKVFASEPLRDVRKQFYSGRPDICSGCNFFRHPHAADMAAARARIDALPPEVRRKLVLVNG